MDKLATDVVGTFAECFSYLKVKYKGILFYEILMDCVARKRMQKNTSNYLKWFPRYCDLNFYMLSH